ncbi:hypothetical protein [Pandoravirus japonicus]|uniref:Uncharacterized protein n=1 Tax=Pandoravirus japonicus TaxID=2823154 RepID=A0A811BPD2_9VIRU|nr:hypothetical protein [Pandoravirus japonicus]
MSDRTTAAYWARAPYRHVKKRRAHRYFGFTVFGACSSCGPLPSHRQHMHAWKRQQEKTRSQVIVIDTLLQDENCCQTFFYCHHRYAL